MDVYTEEMRKKLPQQGSQKSRCAGGQKQDQGCKRPSKGHK